jgi:5-methylcytosine-specific restriction endonuclease McrA
MARAVRRQFADAEERRLGLLENARRCYAKHREQRAIANKVWAQANPEKHRAAVTRYRERHKTDPEYLERVRQYDRERYQRRKDDPHYRAIVKRADQRFRQKHQTDPVYRRRNADRQLAYQRTPAGKASVKAASQNRRVRKQAVEGSFTAQEWRDLLYWYGHRCLCCGRHALQTPELALEADHVVPIARGGTNWITNIQPLCRSCNARKRIKIVDYRVLYGS